MNKLFLFLRLVSKDLWRLWRHRERRYPWGLYLYVGLPGSGKTLSMVEYLYRAKRIYPGCKIYTNFRCDVADGFIERVQEIVDISCDDGVIIALDEVQVNFHARDWKDFGVVKGSNKPGMELIRTITHNRKMKKQILLTTQYFSAVEKTLRELSNFIIECRCFLGRWVFQRAFTQEYYLNYGKDNDRKQRPRAWRYNFIATDELRAPYDTFEIINRLKDLCNEVDDEVGGSLV